MEIKWSREWLWLILIPVIVVAVVKTFHLERVEAISGYRTELATLRERLLDADGMSSELRILDAKLKHAHKVIETLERQQDSSGSWSDLLQRTTQSHNLRLASWNQTAEQRWRIDVQGTTKDLTAWLYEIETTPLPLSVVAIEIHRGDPPIMQVELEVKS